MAEWNRRREASDSDNEDIERAERREDLQQEVVNPSLKVTGWSATQAMRELRDMLFNSDSPAQQEPRFDLRAEKIKQDWTSSKDFVHAARLDDAGQYPFHLAADQMTDALEKQRLVEGKDWFASAHQRTEAMQQLDNNCVPTSVTNAMRDVLRIPVEGGQAGLTRRAMQSQLWDPGRNLDREEPDGGSSSIGDAAKMFEQELRRSGREGEVKVHPEQMSRGELSSLLDSGCAVVAGVPGHCVQVTACDKDSVEVLDPWDGRLYRYTNESWLSFVDGGYASCKLEAGDPKEAM